MLDSCIRINSALSKSHHSPPRAPLPLAHHCHRALRPDAHSSTSSAQLAESWAAVGERNQGKGSDLTASEIDPAPRPATHTVLFFCFFFFFLGFLSSPPSCCSAITRNLCFLGFFLGGVLKRCFPVARFRNTWCSYCKMRAVHPSPVNAPHQEEGKQQQ